jgi:PEP-CTERM motif
MGVWGCVRGVRHWIGAALCAGILMCAATTPSAAQNLVTNGTFVSTTGSGQTFWGGTVTGWSTASQYNPNFSYYSGGTTNPSFYGLYTASNGGASSWNGNSPNNTPYAGLDGDSNPGPISQTISGLISGKTYTLSFVWALAEMNQASVSAITGSLTATLGSSTYTTSTSSVAAKGFSGWMTQSYSYVANATSAILSFTPTGTGQPPMLLLTNVSLTQNGTGVPEPASLVLLGSGVAAMLCLARRRRAPARAA